MQTITDKTVREIALENPASIRVFESLGIDYCCGGKRPLSEACSHAKVDIDHVVSLLERAKAGAIAPVVGEPDTQALSALTAQIVSKHHEYVRRESPRVQGLLIKVSGRHGAAHPEIAKIDELFTAISQELSTHMMKEEQILFPYIVRMEQAVLSGEAIPSAFFGTVQRPIANMVAEHEDAGALLAEIRELSNGFTVPAGACPTFVALYRGLEEFERDLHQHVHLENNVLFPRAIELERGMAE